MSQIASFQKLKCFQEDFTKELEHDKVLEKIKALLKTDEPVSDKTVDQYFERIDTKSSSIISAYDQKIEPFLTGDAKLLLHDRYYFVDQEIWKVIEEKTYDSLKKSIENKSDALEIAEDYALLKTLYESKLLAFEAS